MLSEMSPEKFTEWQEYYLAEPFGSLINARQIGTVIASIAAAVGSELDIDDQLRAWGFHIPLPDFDPDASERAILTAFGG